jgi:hypothetical protein
MSMHKCHKCKCSHTKKHAHMIVASIGLIILVTKLCYIASCKKNEIENQ